MGRRSLQVGVSVAAGVLLVGVAVVPAHANTPVACSDTALIQAINDSNGGLNDHILDLTSYCVYTLTDADGTLPVITQPLVIHGHNATIRRDPNATTNFRILEVGGTSLNMDTLTVMNGDVGTGSNGGGVFLGTSGGSLTATDVNFQGNAGRNGGAVDAEGGTTLFLTRGTVNDNRVSNFGLGGGIRATGATTLTLDSVIVSGNRTDYYGGGVVVDTDTPATITNSTISYNTAKAAGGGLYFTGSNSLTITGTTVADNRVTNSVQSGGGILLDPDNSVVGQTTIADSTISGNAVSGFSAADNMNNRGGGIFHQYGPLVLDNTRIAGNQLIGDDARGAGLATQPDGPGTLLLTLQNGSTITGNLALGRFSKGGGLYAESDDNLPVSVTVTASHIDRNKVSGTGSASGGIYNIGGTISLTSSSVNTNTAPAAPAPGGIWTDTQFTTTTGSTITGNTPTNCLLSPVIPIGCIG